MLIKFESSPKKLFRLSPCTIVHEDISFSFSKESRFGYGSIYPGSQVFGMVKKSKESIQTTIKRMQSQLAQFSSAKKSKFVNTAKNLSVKPNSQIIRLERRSPTARFRNYDRNGFSSSESADEKFRVTKFERTGGQDFRSKCTFTGTERFDYHRPLNFNPGPGHYNPEKDLTERLFSARSAKQLRGGADRKTELSTRSFRRQGQKLSYSRQPTSEAGR